MAILSPPTWTQYGSYDARNDRMHFAGIFETPGATRSTDFAVAQTVVASMDVTISAGAAYFESGYAALQGYYGFINDAPITKTVQPAHATFPRIDRVVARVYDSYFAGTVTAADIEIIAGTPAVSPALPDMPLSAIELARISVAANATTVVTANINNSVMPVAALREPLIANALNSIQWTSYTPTFSGLTVGNATITARYKKFGRVVTVMGQITMGSTTTYAGQFFMTVPVAPGGAWSSSIPIGPALFTDASAGTVAPGNIAPWTATQITFRTAAGAVATNLAPFTWAVSDVIGFTFTYESAS